MATEALDLLRAKVAAGRGAQGRGLSRVDGAQLERVRQGRKRVIERG